MTELKLYNTLTRRKESFTPQDAANVRMYVCGPTVYDRPHLGNARSVVVYDVLYRVLRHLYGEKHVKYVRNITDVDDKINARAKERGISIQKLTQDVTEQFHADMGALNCMLPNIEPRATEHIAEMHAIIEKLLKRGHAYVSENHVLFDVGSVPHYSPLPNPLPQAGEGVMPFVYGMLSHRVQDDLVAGARVEVESYKKNPGDFVLWKPAESGDDPSSVFASPWGPGRPGWHIECSAMSGKHLGDTFDLHGGGADLMFPHHENEIAQSRAANPDAQFARMWVHNGFLTVKGEKMSKSLGNFITVHDFLEKGVRGETIRLCFLSARYSEPLDWNDKLLEDSKKTLDKWYRKLSAGIPEAPPDIAFLDALRDDMNLPRALSLMHTAAPEQLLVMGKLLGFFNIGADEWFKGHASASPENALLSSDSHKSLLNSGVPDTTEIEYQIVARIAAKKAKNYAEADRIRKALADQGILLEDRPDGSTDWRRV